MDNFDLKKYLVENKVTRSSRMIKENQSGSPKLLDFIDGDDERTQMIYDKLGFDVRLDDPANNEFSAEMDFKGYDWLSVLAILEDCEREGVKPFMVWGGKNYNFAQAMYLADQKASGDTYSDTGIGASSGR